MSANGSPRIKTWKILPIVRTFIPILAGLVKIEMKKFVVLNIIGAFTWVSVMFFAGLCLGNAFPGISNHLETIIGSMILITTITSMDSARRKKKIPRTSKFFL